VISHPHDRPIDWRLIRQGVTFEIAAGQLNTELDTVYWEKYGKYPKQYVDPVTNDESHATTPRLLRR